MNYTIEKKDDKSAVLHFTGRLDAAIAQEFKEVLKKEALDGSIYLVIDMEKVTFIDSSGLSGLVSGFKAVREKGGLLVLANVGMQIKVALELTQLNRIFLIQENVEAALEHIKTFTA